MLATFKAPYYFTEIADKYFGHLDTRSLAACATFYQWAREFQHDLQEKPPAGGLKTVTPAQAEEYLKCLEVCGNNNYVLWQASNYAVKNYIGYKFWACFRSKEPVRLSHIEKAIAENGMELNHWMPMDVNMNSRKNAKLTP